MATEGIDPDTVTGLDEVFLDVTHPFNGLETAWFQTGKNLIFQGCTWTVGKYDFAAIVMHGFFTSLGTRRNRDW